MPGLRASAIMKPAMQSVVETYAAEISAQLSSGHAREHAYRPALKELMSAFEDVRAVNDPARSEHGNPDFVFLKDSNHDIILGYAEAKDITISLDKTARSEQLHRYAGYNKLFLTNYLEFRFYRNGEEYERVSIGELKDGEIQFHPQEFARLQNELHAFLQLPPEPIKNGKRLALVMGQKARRIRDNVARYLEIEDERNRELEKIYDMMKKLLVHDLSKEKFADMYAQTLVYGLFAARYHDDTPDDFTRQEASELVPASNPFLREFFAHIGGIHFDKRLAVVVDELCDVFAVSDVQMLVQKHLRILQGAGDKDSIIHFYEDFLKEYDPQERKRMGAYYTPVPVVRFIVRQVDEILKEEFGLPAGLADTSKITREIETGQDLRHDRRKKLVTSIKKDYHRVQILDPAVGTATFLNETIKFIAEKFKDQEGRWPSYVNDGLLPRLSGFELMMAPYTVAHLKLALTLQESGAGELQKRLGIYLTNTLEEGIPAQQDLFTSLGLAGAVTEESLAASEIKHERPVMVVMGNPPYSGVSSNETEYANNLIKKYKVEPGGQQKLQERKHWLNNDYVKFIAFAEDMIAKNGSGIVAMITDNSYLDGLTFRGMRWHLTKTFDKIYVLDLHGNSNKKEVAPGGGKDENIFDIMQGVSIIVGVKTTENTKQATVYHANVFGKRKDKFAALNAEVNWQKITPDAKNIYFTPKNTAGQDEYEKGIKIDDLFLQNVTGIVTMGDNFIINENSDIIATRVQKLANGEYNELQLNHEFGLGKNYAEFVLDHHSKLNYTEDGLTKIDYRPFDTRWTYFDNKVLWRWRENVMKNFFKHDNIGVVYNRRIESQRPFADIFIAENLVDARRVSLKETNFVSPLYLYHDDGSPSLSLRQWW